jgi:hypothetical protein
VKPNAPKIAQVRKNTFDKFVGDLNLTSISASELSCFQKNINITVSYCGSETILSRFEWVFEESLTKLMSVNFLDVYGAIRLCLYNGDNLQHLFSEQFYKLGPVAINSPSLFPEVFFEKNHCVL